MRANGELLQRLVASAGVVPEIRIDGAAGLVEARFLESSAAMLLIAINHADTPQKVTFAFGPDVPEAIWQNMESGAAVNFVQSPAGPTYAHAFAPRDAMVLVGASGCGKVCRPQVGVQAEAFALAGLKASPDDRHLRPALQDGSAMKTAHRSS